MAVTAAAIVNRMYFIVIVVLDQDFEDGKREFSLRGKLLLIHRVTDW